MGEGEPGGRSRRLRAGPYILGSALLVSCRPTSDPPSIDQHHGARQVAPTVIEEATPVERGANPQKAERALQVAMERHLPGVPAWSPLGAGETSLPGRHVAIENAEALAGFYAALASLEAESGEPKVRLAMYGASGTASDRATGFLRTYAQARFGDGGPGFVPWAPLSRWYRHSEIKLAASPHWKKEHAQVGSARPDGQWGYLGASFWTSRSGAWVEVEPLPEAMSAAAIASFELFALGQPTGGSVDVFVDGEKQVQWSTRAERQVPSYLRVPVTPGFHRLRIETVGDGEVRGFGIVLETAMRGVVVDTLGIDGTRMTNLLAWNTLQWIEQVRHRDVDLLVFSFGTNEASDRDAHEDPDASRYREQMTTVLSTLRNHLPDVGCLLLLPGDYPIVDAHGVRPRPRLEAILEIQRMLASQHGCAWWDGMAFMGGPGSMARFVTATPPMAQPDYLHFNARGAVRKGQALVQALLGPWDSLGGVPDR